MPFTDTASAPVVYMGATNFQSRTFLQITDTDGRTRFEVCRFKLQTTVREIRGLDWDTATTSAAYWSGQANTSAVVSRATDAGHYTVTVTVESRSLTPDT